MFIFKHLYRKSNFGHVAKDEDDEEIECEREKKNQ
jgi:hypothetical protein